MITKEQISTIVEDELRETDRFLADVKVKPNNTIEVYIDSDTAVTVDDCATLSRAIEDKLDRDVEDYELSVCSYGLTNPLVMDRQLNKYVGKDVEVKMADKTKMVGTLLSFDSTSLSIAVAPKKSSKKKLSVAEGNVSLERSKVEVRPLIVF